MSSFAFETPRRMRVDSLFLGDTLPLFPADGEAVDASVLGVTAGSVAATATSRGGAATEVL